MLLQGTRAGRAVLAGAAALTLVAGGAVYADAARGSRVPRQLPVLADQHPHWPDHYNHFILTVANPRLRAGGQPGAMSKVPAGTALPLPASGPRAANRAPASEATSSENPWQAVAPNPSDPIILRAGEPASLLPGRLARYPKGTKLERDSQGNIRAVLPAGSRAPRSSPSTGPASSRAGPRTTSGDARGLPSEFQRVVKSLLDIPGVHQASHVWGNTYSVATTLTQDQIAALPGVSDVARNNLLSFSSVPPATNDPDLADEYYVSNFGQNIQGQTGTPGASGDFAYAWARSRGHSVVIADIDTGVDLNNPDLAGQILPTSENFMVSPPNNDVQAQGTAAGFYHATTVDGVIAAIAGNGTEGAGAAPETKILALKCSDGSQLSSSCIYEAGEYAISQHVQIINMSFDEQASSDTYLTDLVSDAQKAGILITASAGNSGTDNDTTPQLPASLESSYNNIITVGATDNQDNLATYSDYGASTVDLMAPGTNVFTDYPTYTGYSNAYASGTSYAAPLVAATAALLWSINPNLSYSQVKSDILGSAQTVPALSGKCVTGGRLDAAAAVAKVTEPVQWSFTGFDQIQPAAPASVSIGVTAENGALPSSTPLGYHLEMAYDYQGTVYYLANETIDWSMGGSTPQPVTTGSDGSVFITPGNITSTNYGANPLDISVPNPGLPSGYYALVAYAATTAAPSTPIGNQQAVFFDVGSVPLPPSPSTTAATSTTTATTAATTTTAGATSTTSGGATTTTAAPTTTAPTTTTTAAPITSVPAGTTPTVVQGTTTTTAATTTTTGGTTTTSSGTTTTSAGGTTTTTTGGTTTTAAGTTTTTATGTTTTTAGGSTTTTTGSTTTTAAGTTTTTTGSTTTTTTGSTTTTAGGTTTTTSAANFWLTLVSPNQLATTGGAIQIFGNNLPTNPIAQVGVTYWPATWVSSTEVDVTVGAMSSGTYSVTVYNANQTQSATLNAALTIGSGSGTTTTTAGGGTTTTSSSGATTTTNATTTTTTNGTTTTGATTTTTAGGTTTTSAGTTTTTNGTTTTGATTTTTSQGTTTTGPGGTINGPGGTTLAPVPSSDSINTVAPGEWPAFSASQIISDNNQSPGSTVDGVDV
jgi:serine protease